MNTFTSLCQTITGIIKIATFLTMVALFVPCAVVYKRLYPKDAFRLPIIFHTLLLKLLGIKLRVHGTPSTAAPVFFVANHASYLDILVLGSMLSASFVAKMEVASWPLFGFLSKVQNTIFVERKSTRAAAQRTQLQDCLADRRNIILFPEGTSSDGLTALPFKSSLFSIVEDCGDGITATVQPLSLTCTELDQRPILPAERDLYAWYGDMTLEGHLWTVFKRGHFTVDVIFHPPLAPADFENRKLLAQTCQNMVVRGIEQSLSGISLLTKT